MRYNIQQVCKKERNTDEERWKALIKQVNKTIFLTIFRWELQSKIHHCTISSDLRGWGVLNRYQKYNKEY